MDQKTLKTSWQQRIVYVVVLVVMIFAFIASYAGIVLSGNSSNSTATQDEKLEALQSKYTDKQNEMTAYASSNMANKHFSILEKYRSRVKAYNATTANNDGLKTTDLVVGTGAEITAENPDYFAYYIGWCADESVFDSSFDDFKNPTTLSAPLSGSISLIEGWSSGVIGMKIGGIREISMPGELAYGETQEICGGTNSPLKFIVYAVQDEGLKNLSNELDSLYNEILDYYYSQNSNE